MAVDFKPKATSTVQFTPRKQSAMPQPAQEQPGFLKSVVMGTGIPRLAANVVNTGHALANFGRAIVGAPLKQIDTAKSVNMPWLGAVKPVGMEGTVGEQARDIAGESLKFASTIVPVGGAAKTIGQATLAGRVALGAKTGIAGGVTGGAMYGLGEGIQQKDATLGSVAGSTALGGIVGGLTGGALGTAIPLVGATARGTKNLVTQKGRQEIAENTMNRVARINPTDYNKFKKTTGKDTGAYLVERGIYGNDKEIVQKLTDDWMRSKKIVDDAFTEMGGTWRHAPVKDALEMLAEREAKVSTPNVKSPDFDTVQALLKKYNTEGLTMSEVNEVKRLLERNVKLDYLKPNSMNPEKVTQATNVDNAIRTWQVDMADKLGLQNLRELNKNTQASRMLADSLYKKMTGQSGNNAIGLGDLVLLSGGDVRNIAMAGARTFFGSKSVQSNFAKAISPVKGKSVLPVTRGPITDPARRLPDPSFIPMGGKVQGDASFVRAVPAQNAVPERLMLNAGDTVSPINQGRAIPVMPRPINGDYLGKEVIAGRSTLKPQQTPRTPDQLRMPSATVKQGSPTQSTQLSTATRQGAQKSSLSNSTPANASVATNVSDRELQAAKNVYLKSASADAFPQLAEKIKNARSFDEIAELIKTEGGNTSGLQYASNMSSRFKQELASLDDPAMIKRLTREQSTTQKGITQKVKDWYKASGLDDERGFIKVPYIRDDIGSYVQSDPRGRRLDVEARKLFNIFKDEPTADESAMYVVRQFLSGKSGGGINRTELATALDILRNNAKKIYVAQRPAQRAPSNKSVMPKPKQKAEPKSKEKSLYSKIKDFLFPPGIPRDRGMVNLKAIADDLTGKTSKADDLLTEARKYKTAEEFVNAKSGAFHGSAKEISGLPRPSKDGILGEGFYITDDADVAEWFGKQVNVPEDMQIEGLKKVSDSSIKPIVYSVDTSKVKLKELNNADGLMDALRGRTIQQLRKELLYQGFDGISLTKRGESIVFPESISKVGVKTRTQLEDIWNQANKSTQKAVSTTDNLITEAKKYETLEEFVKAQEGGIKQAQTGKPVTARMYHGSPDARFAEEFDPMKTGYYKDAPDLLPDMREWESLNGKPSQGFRAESIIGKKGVSFTDSRATAKSYSEKPAFDTQNSVPMVLERYVMLKNPKVYDMGGKKWDLNMELEMRTALENGYDGLVFKNILDDYHPFNSKTPANNIIVFDTNAIKTRAQLTEIWNKAHSKSN